MTSPAATDTDNDEQGHAHVGNEAADGNVVADWCARIDGANDEELTGPFLEALAKANIPNLKLSTIIKKIVARTKQTAGDIKGEINRLRRHSQRHSGNWVEKLTRDRDGGHHGSMGNIHLILSNDPDWRGVLKLDLLQMDEVKAKKPPFADVAETGRWVDQDTTRTGIWLSEKYRVRATPQTIDDVVKAVADANRFHPVVDYLNSLQWDGVPRIHQWLSRYLGAAIHPTISKIGRMWMIGAVARVMDPGCRMDNTLILEGNQGTFKSTAVKVLAGPEWFLETSAELGTKEIMEVMGGKWIVELQELHSLTSAQMTKAKAFLTTTTDEYRPAYARRKMRLPRQCVFVGTTNETKYLTDHTGNRRFWPITVIRCDIPALTEDRNQLWAEAVLAYRSGDVWWTDGDTEIEALQSDRQVDDPWMIPIGIFAESQTVAGKEFSSQDIMDLLGLDVDKRNRAHSYRIGMVMRQLGYVLGQKTRRADGVFQFWRRFSPPRQNIMWNVQ